MMITRDTVGSEMLSGGVLWMKAGAVVKPCHAHADAEEVVYITKGNGKVWIDGELHKVPAGSCAFFPKGSKHMLKNSGRGVLQAIFLYSPPTDPSRYQYYRDIEFPDEN